MEINEALKDKGIPLFFPVSAKAEGVPESLIFTSCFTSVYSSIRVPPRLLVAC